MRGEEEGPLGGWAGRDASFRFGRPRGRDISTMSLVPGRERLEGKWKIKVEFEVVLDGGRYRGRMEVMRKAGLFIFLHAASNINYNSCTENCISIYNT